MRRAVLVFALAASALPIVAQSEKLDFAMLGRIRDEGLNRSQVMDHVSWLSDVFGPRLTGSPTARKAADYTIAQLKGWGLDNPHLENFPFGRGWTNDKFYAQVTLPVAFSVIGPSEMLTSK